MPSLYTPAVAEMLAQVLPPLTVDYARVAAQEQDRQYAADGGGGSLGYLAFALTHALGVELAASRAGAEILDLLQPAIDLADNLADEEEDRGAGRNIDARYPGLPRPGRFFLPALLVGTATWQVFARFPAPAYQPSVAARRLVATLAALNEAQAVEGFSLDRSEALGREYGRLWCLALWALPPGHPVGPRVARVEAWAAGVGRTLQLRVDQREGRAGAEERLRAVVEAESRRWPRFGPFLRGGPFARDRVLLGADS